MKGMDLRRITSPVYIKSSEDRETLDILETKIFKKSENGTLRFSRENGTKRGEKKKRIYEDLLRVIYKEWAVISERAEWDTV